MSSKSLTPSILKSLNLGFGFMPTPSYNAFHTRVDLYKLFRNIKLKRFEAKETCSFKKKSLFVPNVSDSAITVFEKMVLKDISTLEQSRYGVKYNMSKLDLSELKDLASDNSVVLKPANKGSAIVVLDTSDYMREAYRQLNDTSSYYRIAQIPPDPS